MRDDEVSIDYSGDTFVFEQRAVVGLILLQTQVFYGALGHASHNV